MADSEKLALDALRGQIDALDSKMLELLNERASLAQSVAKTKRDASSSFYRPTRERAIIDTLQAKNSGPFPGDAIRPVFQEIISACLSLEQGMDIAYLGPEATFTHQATKRHFGSSANTIPCGTIRGVFDEVARKQAAYGVVPVENSSEGVVNHTLDCFVDSPLHIIAEIVVDIEHCLLAKDGIKLTNIERVYSHPQPLGQCRSWLTTNLKSASLVQASSTADAARAAQGDSAGAAISAELAARMYGLNVLRRKIQDRADNRTRFLVIGREPIARPQSPAARTATKTSLLMVVHDKPGALLDVLAHFKHNQINLSKIESRPSKRKLWDYVFFLDFDGHSEDKNAKEVIAALRRECELLKVLGSYSKADIHE